MKRYFLAALVVLAALGACLTNRPAREHLTRLARAAAVGTADRVIGID